MQIAFLFYDGMTALDAIGPHEVLTRLPGVEVKRVARTSVEIQSESAGLVLHAEYTLAQVRQADVLLVPGSGRALSFSQDQEILDWVRQIHNSTTYTTSVCTGSLILGAAGILNGVQATSHWTTMDKLATFGAIPISKRVVTAGKIITAAGVSAGIDMALTLSAKTSGEEVAKMLQLSIEYDPEPPFDCGSPHKVSESALKTLKERMTAKFEV